MIAVLERLGIIITVDRLQPLGGDDVVKSAVAEAFVERVYLAVSPLVPEYVNHPDVTDSLEDVQRRIPPPVADLRTLTIYVVETNGFTIIDTMTHSTPDRTFKNILCRCTPSTAAD